MNACEGCEHPKEEAIENNQMLDIDISDNNTDTFN